jgi:hypothetical protein
MFSRRALLLIALCAIAAVTAFAQQSSITPESLRGWLTYLSSDELEGRATFAEGLGLAAAYIADQLKEAGVKPGGDNGSYFQRVEVLGVRSTNHSTVTVEVNGQKRTFKDGEGVTFTRNVGGKRSLTLHEVEFAGYGLDLDADYNDYKNLDVKGKLVVWLGDRGPHGTDQQQARRLLGGRTSFAIEEMGAAATVAPQPEGGGPRGGRGGGNGPDFVTVQRLDSAVPPSITASEDFLEFLFSGSDIKYADLKTKAQQQDDLPKFDLKGVNVTFDIDADYQVINTRYTRNVVAVVDGTDPQLKDTYVAFGAHYDHIGYVQNPLAGGQTDRINNGADDDGSGTTALIGIARAFARGPKTKRSMLFVWHTGEELGLYGSKYFADHPTVPIEKIVTQLNMDMIGRNKNNLESESNTVYPVGSDRISSELHQILLEANAGLPTPMVFNYQLNEPTDPERVYYRSDHYSYAAKGIPIIFFTTNLHPDYHRVTDSVEKIQFDKMARITQLIYETGRRVGNLDHAPFRDFKGAHLAVGTRAK